MSSDDKFRISRVVTRTGDGGDTGLADGRRVRKSHARIQALGSVDELNAHLGLLGAHVAQDPGITTDIRWLQNRLFDLGAAIAVGSPPRSLASHVEQLDMLVARRGESLPPLREFVLPAGPLAATQAHVARTVCRRAERDLVVLADAEPEAVDASWQQFVNRLSDALFIMSRELARAAGPEVGWEPAKG